MYFTRSVPVGKAFLIPALEKEVPGGGKPTCGLWVGVENQVGDPFRRIDVRNPFEHLVPRPTYAANEVEGSRRDARFAGQAGLLTPSV